MKSIIAALQIAMQELRTKANSALKGMAPLDQYEGSQEVAYAIRSLKWAEDSVTDMLGKVDEVMAKYDPEVKAAAELLVAAEVSAKIAAGELLPKADVEAAVAAAKLTGRQEAEAAFQLREQEAAALAGRRAEIVSIHGAEVAASVPDEALKAEGFDAFKTELARRVNKLAEIGVTAAQKKTAFAEIACGIAFDEAGVTAFDTRFESIKELVGPKGATGGVAASTPPAKVPGSGQPPAPAAPTTPSGAPVYGF